MISRQEVKRMLREGLTGQEAGRLVLLDSVEVDHGRPGILTSKELERIKRSLLPEEASVYNAIVYAYQMTGYSLLEAHGHYLEAMLNLERTASPITLYAIEAMLQEARKWYPLIWTEKQLQENTPPEGRPVAIIHDPDPELMDDQGYYSIPEPLSEGMIKSLTLVKLLEEDLEGEEPGYLEVLNIFSKRARDHIRALKAYHQALEELSSLLDVPLTEDFGPWWQSLGNKADEYNKAFSLHGTGLLKITVEGDKGERLSQIRLKMLKADQDLLDYMRDRIAMALGENWWEEAGHGE